MTQAAVRDAHAFSLSRLFDLWSMDRPGVVWRHDVDNHLPLARQMARLEKSADIRAVYYVHADPTEYAGDAFEMAIEDILSCGHDLGTHVDLKLGRDETIDDDALGHACAVQSAALEAWPVGNRVSLHRPPHDTVWRTIPGFDHALGPEWWGRYSSDSRQRFRTSPEVLLRRRGRVQINLHPCWWLLPIEQAQRLRLEHERVNVP